MRIILAGAGEVGFHLAELLSIEGHDITVIDVDRDKLQYISNQLDLDVINGSSTSVGILQTAQVQKADLLIAVSNSEEVNLTTCMFAKHLGAKKTVARISNVEYILSRDRFDLTDMGIDELISPASLAAKEIKRLLRESALTDYFDFDNGKLSLIGIKVEEENKLAGETVEASRHLNPDQDFTPVAILRNNETIIPRPDTKFQINDHAYFITQPDGINKILKLAHKERYEIKNVMILGGSNVGYHAARTLSKKYGVKLIEPQKSRCYTLADELPNTLIINADGRDVDVLEEENLSEMDAFIAVTDNSETNIITSLVAKNHGVQKTIALVENIDYIHLSQSIGVDTLINKKLIAANFIFRYIRKGEIVSLTSLHGADVEVLEFEVQENSKVADSALQDIPFPRNSIVGGVIRNGVGFAVRGDFVFKPKDHVVILAKPTCINKIEAFFK